jgi:hypothetical protein
MIDDGIKPMTELHALFTPANKSKGILAWHPPFTPPEGTCF